MEDLFMRLRFEKWYEEKINGDAKELFNESCLCYKVGAYRATFLMSYLGFQSVLKERMLKKPKAPNGLSQRYWDTIQNKLRDDKTWDDTVFEAVDKNQPASPFLINDDLRKQYRYFRCIRNDCAHAKSNIISYPHVESLWLFIESNYNKFVVNGGRDGLLERISIHYNPTYTKPGSDISPIIEDISTSMNVTEIPLFLKDVHELLEDKSLIYTSFEDEEFSDFWKKIVFSSDEELVEAMIIFVKGDWDIFLNFINRYPYKLIDILLSSTDQFKREFWNEKIFNMSSFWHLNVWDILKRVLESNIVPKDELNKFIKKASNKFKEVPPKEYLEFFRTVGYLDELKRMHFECGNNFNSPGGIDYANRNWTSISPLIENIELDYDIVSQLNKAFMSASYGIYYDGMKILLENNHEFRNKYEEILVKNSCLIPQCILDLEE